MADTRKWVYNRKTREGKLCDTGKEAQALLDSGDWCDTPDIKGYDKRVKAEKEKAIADAKAVLEQEGEGQASTPDKPVEPDWLGKGHKDFNLPELVVKAESLGLYPHKDATRKQILDFIQNAVGPALARNADFGWRILDPARHPEITLEELLAKAATVGLQPPAAGVNPTREDVLRLIQERLAVAQ